MGKYDELFQRSITDPEGFWGEAAEAITWSRKWDKVLDDSKKPFFHWFSGGEMNTCYNALDRHVASGRADQVALIYDSPVTGTIRSSPTGNCLTRSPGSPGF
jgi:propionyl-CoA synthetase